MAVDASNNRRCRVAGCGKRHVYNTLSDGSRIYSSYCEEHTCQAPRNELVPFCINPRGPGNRYCSFHGKCRALACTQQASRIEKLPFPYLCPDHRCTQCTSTRFGGFQVCEAHLTCQVRGCAKRPDLDHANLYCYAHSCTMVSRCSNQAVAFTHGVSHCPYHLPCGVVRGCTRLRVRLPDGRQLAHCDEHVMCQGTGCRSFARSGTSFCPMHKCSLEGCPGPKDAQSHYCQRHTCARDRCTQILHRLENSAARFCSAHECSAAAASCLAEAKTAHGYCEVHACTHGSCNAVRAGGTTYCADHRCQSASGSCKHVATHRNGFCRGHACEVRNCRQPRLGGPDHIPLCLMHWTKEVERRAASEVGHEAHLRQADLEEELFQYEEREQLRKAREQEARRKEEELRRIRAAAQQLRVEEEARRVKAEKQRADEEQRIRAAAEELLETQARQQRRAERERQRRLEEEERVAKERAERRAEREAREQAADRRWAAQVRREQEARREREQAARMRERMRMSTDGYAHVPAGRRGMRRDSLYEWSL